RQRRGGRPDRELTNGPARLCQALAIDGSLNGADLCDGRRLFVEAAPPVPNAQVARGPRVGVRGDRRALTVPWRFWVRNNPYVSRGAGNAAELTAPGRRRADQPKKGA
ncbi:MAG: 3-methyladenine DNA glycosylase, partial [Chloroflexi bacterium]